MLIYYEPHTAYLLMEVGKQRIRSNLDAINTFLLYNCSSKTQPFF